MMHCFVRSAVSTPLRACVCSAAGMVRGSNKVCSHAAMRSVITTCRVMAVASLLCSVASSSRCLHLSCTLVCRCCSLAVLACSGGGVLCELVALHSHVAIAVQHMQRLLDLGQCVYALHVVRLVLRPWHVPVAPTVVHAHVAIYRYRTQSLLCSIESGTLPRLSAEWKHCRCRCGILVSWSLMADSLHLQGWLLLEITQLLLRRLCVMCV